MAPDRLSLNTESAIEHESVTIESRAQILVSHVILIAVVLLFRLVDRLVRNHRCVKNLMVDRCL